MGEEMKIRNGFVSNSSSSSFIIHGAWINIDDVSKHLSEEDKAAAEKWGYEEVLYDLPMFIYYNSDTEACAFGKSYSSIGDNETGKQFKDTIKKTLEDKFEKSIKCSVIEHTSYD